VALVDATLAAVRLRLRPILMTSLAFMFGVLPLAISSGAGAGSRRAIGTGVLGGMATATLLGIFFVPVFYVLVRGLVARLAARRAGPAPVPRWSPCHEKASFRPVRRGPRGPVGRLRQPRAYLPGAGRADPAAWPTGQAASATSADGAGAGRRSAGRTWSLATHACAR
jgi:hypothetical protein